MSNPIIADDVLTANPRLLGMSALQVLDETIEALAGAKVITIINNY